MLQGGDPQLIAQRTSNALDFGWIYGDEFHTENACSKYIIADWVKFCYIFALQRCQELVRRRYFTRTYETTFTSIA